MPALNHSRKSDQPPIGKAEHEETACPPGGRTPQNEVWGEEVKSDRCMPGGKGFFLSGVADLPYLKKFFLASKIFYLPRSTRAQGPGWQAHPVPGQETPGPLSSG